MSFGGFNPLGGRGSNEKVSPDDLRQQQILKTVCGSVHFSSHSWLAAAN